MQLSIARAVFPFWKIEADKIKVSLLCLLMFIVLHSPVAFANNLNISNVSAPSQNTSSDTVTVQFDISWDNSWRDPANYDAAWVFIKYSTDSGATWKHAKLKTSGTNPSGFSTGAGTGIEMVVPTDKLGCFIQRSSDLSSSTTGEYAGAALSVTGVQVLWDYASDGISDVMAASSAIRFKVFGIEMVYIPQGSFYAGDNGDASTNHNRFGSGTTSSAYSITSEDALALGSGGLGNQDAQGMISEPFRDDFNNTTSQTLSAAFPKGYHAFYLMKYELTQGQYAGFLNTLTRKQQNRRVRIDLTGDTLASAYVMAMEGSTFRNVIQAPTSGNGTTNPVQFHTTENSVNKKDRGCNLLYFPDLAAYADWAGLRPVTELEYEKAARGSASPVSMEYAWGTATALAAVRSTEPENGQEIAYYDFDGGIYANFHNIEAAISGDVGSLGQGPLRVGIFANRSSFDYANENERELSGAGYYGNMELTGNVSEWLVSVGSSSGRNFSGTHGDGLLTTLSGYEGNATNTDWPGLDGTTTRGVTGCVGAGLKYGSGDPVSDRYYANYCNVDYENGGRLARTA